MAGLDHATVQRLYRQATADRWQVPFDAFAALLTRSAERAFANEEPDRVRLNRYLSSLHLEDLALACACAEGIESAWEHFVREYRPVLYRAADAIDRSGAARDAADSLYAELFGLGLRDGERHSHFRYFHGRSSLATWLRAVLSQRYVDRVRRDARLDPLPADDGPGALVVTPSSSAAEPRHLDVLQRVLAAVVAALVPRDRLRLRCYYAQDLTLAQIGRVLGEHEATASRNLARTRRFVKDQVVATLREREGMSAAAIAATLEAAVQDAGALDLAELLGSDADPAERARKVRQDRSK